MDNYITANEKKNETNQKDLNQKNQKNAEKQIAFKNELLDLLSNIDKSEKDFYDIVKSLKDKLVDVETNNEIFNDFQSKSEAISEKLKKLEEKIKNEVGN